MKKIIAITGPESTAKSTLTRALAEHFDADFFPEFAREYLKDKGHNYSYDDVVSIAKKQIEQYNSIDESQSNIVIFDTWLIITKIWFKWVYNRVPDWLEDAINNLPIGLYLLCRPDIPWEPDPLRENGGEQRETLFNLYKDELIAHNCKFVEIEGYGEIRIQNAIKAINLNI